MGPHGGLTEVERRSHGGRTEVERRLNGGWGGLKRFWGFEFGRACFLVEIDGFERIGAFSMFSCFFMFFVFVHRFERISIKYMQIWLIQQIVETNEVCSCR